MTDGPVAGQGRLTGWNVLVPHGGEWGERVTRLLAAEGATSVVVPLIDFAPAPDPDAVDEALRRLAAGRYAWLTVTSGTTVTALAARAAAVVGGGEAQALGDVLGGARVAAVGPGTARALARVDVVPDLVPSTERSARGLVADFPPPAVAPDDEGRGGRVLAPHSDIAEPTLVDGLRRAGWTVDEVVAYCTVHGPAPDPEVREAWRTGAVDAVLLSSASTVTATLDLLGPPPARTVVASIGPRTTAAALEHGLVVSVQPAQASAEELVAALAHHARDHDLTGTRPPTGGPGLPTSTPRAKESSS